MSKTTSSSSSQDLLLGLERKPDVTLKKADGTIYKGYCEKGTTGTDVKGWSVCKISETTLPNGDKKMLIQWALGNPDYYGNIFDQCETLAYYF